MTTTIDIVFDTTNITKARPGYVCGGSSIEEGLLGLASKLEGLVMDNQLEIPAMVAREWTVLIQKAKDLVKVVPAESEDPEVDDERWPADSVCEHLAEVLGEMVFILRDTFQPTGYVLGYSEQRDAWGFWAE